MWWIQCHLDLDGKDNVPFSHKIANKSDRPIRPSVSRHKAEKEVASGSDESTCRDSGEVDKMYGACC
jgi:hypothetical protein